MERNDEKERRHVTHSIPPTFDERSRVLVLGTMPSPASREAGFNYGHPRNRFWPVMAYLAGEPVPTTTERRRDFCLRHHIALWDVLAECDIEGASDASIRNARPNRLRDVVDAAPIEAVYCTGSKAHELYTRLCEANVGMPAAKLPSTSPANAACSFEQLVGAYARVFRHEHPFQPPVMDVPDVVATEKAIDAAGTSLAELMDRAGTALAWRIERMLAEMDAGTHPACKRIGAGGDGTCAILCGNGNNGGDGWVAAAQLARAGRAVRVIAARHPNELTAQPAHDAAVRALGELMERGGVVIGPGDDVPDDDFSAPVVLVGGASGQSQPLIERARVVVDALLGTGAQAAPRAPFSEWVEAANTSRERHAIIAADVPSGVSASTGEAFDPHVIADETLTMIVPKPGLYTPDCGQVRVAPLAYLEPFIA